MKKIFTIVLLLMTNICLAQVADQFSDGDFTANPNWSGNSTHFTINGSLQLQLNNTVAGTSFLTTPFSAGTLDNFEWDIYVRQNFSPSGSNYGRIYLTSTQADLQQPLDGYYLQLGEAGSADALTLFRQSGTSSVQVCRATAGSIASSFTIRIHVTRSSSATWQLMVDYTGGTSFKEEATGVDGTHTSSSFFGILCLYTAGNANRFLFDDIKAGPPPGDVIPPVVVPASFGDIVINEFFPDPSPQIGLPSQEFVEIYNNSEKAFDLGSWRLSDPGSSAVLPSRLLLPGAFAILTTSAGVAAYAGFGTALGLANFPTLNNGADVLRLTDPTGLLIDSVNYTIQWYHDEDKAQGGFTLERLGPSATSNDPTSWFASKHVAGGTPGERNSVFGMNPDTRPPQVVHVEARNDNVLVVAFDETINSYRISPKNFVVDGGVGRPASLSMGDGRKLTLTFAIQFTNGIGHTITIAGVEDLAGNRMDTVTMAFRYFVSGEVSPGVFLINEIMADPTPIVQSPEAEFIEIVNVSTSPFDLKDWILADGSHSTRLGSRIVLPGAFLVLTSTGNVSKFSPETPVLGVTNFPSLSNSGELIVLKSNDSTMIDSIAYSISWYQDKSKEDGGWSIERLRYNYASTDSLNWRAAEDEKGATPGLQNSVYGKNPDNIAPFIVSVAAGLQFIRIQFSESLDTTQLTVHNFNVSDFDGPDVVFFRDRSQVSLTFAAPFENGREYTLSLSGLRDLSGNALRDPEKKFMYFVPAGAVWKDVIVTEIMADPSPTQGLPEAEYLEIYNRSGHALDVDGWKITDGGGHAVIPRRILLPSEYLVLTSPAGAIKFPSATHVVPVPNFPSLNNDGESIIIRDAQGLSIDSVNYSIAWYGNTEKEDGGWSLELIDPTNPCGEEDNWTASWSDLGGTPGSQNAVLASKPDVTGPQLLSVRPAGASSLLLSFSEKLASTTPQYGVFAIDHGIEIVRANFADVTLRVILLELRDTLEKRVLYTVNATVSDCSGNPNQEIAVVTFALPEEVERGDVVINEILFNPRPNGVDFVELFNRSPKFLDLTGWTISGSAEDDRVAKTIGLKQLLMPGAFVVLTADPPDIKSNYPAAKDESLYPLTLPSMPDDEGEVVIRNGAKEIVDEVSYSAQWHSPLVKEDDGVSLERVDSDGPGEDVNNWRSANSTSGFATPGYMNSNSRPNIEDDGGEHVILLPEVMSMNRGDGFTTIRYHFEESGYIANVKVYDVNGRLIKGIANNQSLGADGFFRWDGDREDGTRARNGYYLVWFEVFHLDGSVKTFRRRIVVVS